MSKKFSAQRKNAFLRYLSQTGNQTLSAERAKVSRSWVRLHRSSDPAFDAACREAIEEAKAVLRDAASSGSVAPQDERLKRNWRYFDGHELVVRGTGGSGGGKRVQIGRARAKQWAPRTEKRFLSVLSATCNVKAACAEVGLWPPSAYNHRQRWPAFFELWEKGEKLGFLRLDAAIVENGANVFSEREVDPDIEIRGMTIEHVMQAIHMHKHAVRGLGKAPGLPPSNPSAKEVADALAKRLKSFIPWWEAQQKREG